MSHRTHFATMNDSPLIYSLGPITNNMTSGQNLIHYHEQDLEENNKQGQKTGSYYQISKSAFRISFEMLFQFVLVQSIEGCICIFISLYLVIQYANSMEVVSGCYYLLSRQ